ncbi:hypothetical protein [Hymenobacter sp. BT190]|uniref:hypothetical protein n=1 Tax=Hymenobacter sp. BT190 TaxID=2763505 RepID=UPI0016518EF6|nr:hypothetical protein [Hymenobacter sp. BT190]MBC6697348.1 hypothetical protein [Hymenobacter sp. BT190]
MQPRVEQLCGGRQQGLVTGALLAALQVVVAQRAVSLALAVAYERAAVGDNRRVDALRLWATAASRICTGASLRPTSEQ